MSRRSSKLLPLLLVVLFAGLGLAAWMFLSEAPRETTDFGALELASGPAGPQGSSVESLPVLPTDAKGNEAAPAQDESERRAQATAEEAEMSAAIWLEGHVVFPEGTPYGEVVEVVALGRKFKTREMHRAKVATDGKFRVAFANGTTSGRLDIDAQHLFLDKPVPVRLTEAKRPKDLALEPFLGGALRGQLRLPQGAEKLGPELVGKTVRASGWSNRWNDQVSRGAKVDEQLRFELRGLPPELGLELVFDSDVVGKLSVEDIRAPAGETLERVFDLEFGVRVLGKVRSAEGSLPKNAALQVRIKATGSDGQGTDRDNARLGEDGSFDLRGLPPGKIELTASAPQRVTAKLELGEMANGAVREGVELVLGMGHTVAGRVVWPDKSPAVDATVAVVGGGGDDDPFNPFDGRFHVRSNAYGEFQVAGLNAGPYVVVAQGKPMAEDGERRVKGPTWKARIENVAADTTGLEVELVAGYSVEGIVLDDVGAPVKAFGVIAMAKDEGKRSFSLSRMVSGLYKPDDGRFELGGLLEGGYTLRLNVPGHDDPEPLEVSVPAPGATYTFIAPRRAMVAGVVVKPDGSPAVRAEVNVYGSQGRWSDGGDDKADNQGKFEIKAAQTGKIWIEAKLPGFAPSERLDTELVGGQSLRDLRLVLRVGGRITGEVLPSRTGERVDGRRVTAARSGNGGNEDTTTDRGGKFEFTHLPPGDYAVSAEAAPSELDLLRDPGTRRGNDWELIEATKKRGSVTITDGGSAHVVLGAPPVAPVVISGVVRRGSQGVAGVRITAQGDGERSWERRKLGRTDDTGAYQVTVDGPGKYQIQVTPAGRGGTLLGTHVTVPAEGLSGVDFALASGQIAGLVRGPDGEELGWVQVQLARSNDANAPSSSWTSGSTQTDTEGHFAFKDVPGGQYTVTVSGSSWNRRSFEQRQYGKVTREVALAEGQEITDLDIRLVAAGTLKVTVLLADGSAAPNGRVAIVRTDSGASFSDNAWFNRGELNREDLEPGTYQLRAESGEQVTTSAETVHVLGSETTALTLRLRAGGFVRVQIVDAEGKPTQGAARIFDSNGRPLAANPLMHGMRSPVLPPGTCRVVGTNAKGEQVEVEARVEAGETADSLLQFP